MIQPYRKSKGDPWHVAQSMPSCSSTKPARRAHWNASGSNEMIVSESAIRMTVGWSLMARRESASHIAR